MPSEIKTINLGVVNCYLIRTDNGYILIDTGGRDPSHKNLSIIRDVLEEELENAGCLPGHLNLILLTHGHFDHTDNCAYLRKKYKTKIAMHREDSDMVENGTIPDKKFRPYILKVITKCIMFFTRNKAKIIEILNQFERFVPDLYVDEGFSLSEYGFDAKILHIPGHSKGSIGILTSSCDLFCGDIMVNIFNKPLFNRFMADDNFNELDSSIERLKKLTIKTVYPGHGRPFPMDKLKK